MKTMILTTIGFCIFMVSQPLLAGRKKKSEVLAPQKTERAMQKKAERAMHALLALQEEERAKQHENWYGEWTEEDRKMIREIVQEREARQKRIAEIAKEQAEEAERTRFDRLEAREREREYRSDLICYLDKWFEEKAKRDRAQAIERQNNQKPETKSAH